MVTGGDLIGEVGDMDPVVGDMDPVGDFIPEIGDMDPEEEVDVLFGGTSTGFSTRVQFTRNLQACANVWLFDASSGRA